MSTAYDFDAEEWVVTVAFDGVHIVCRATELAEARRLATQVLDARDPT